MITVSATRRLRLYASLALLSLATLGLSSCSRGAPNKEQALAAISLKLKESLAPCELKEPLKDFNFEPFPPDKAAKPDDPEVRLWGGNAPITISCPQIVKKAMVSAVVAVRPNGTQFLLVVGVY